MDRRSTLLGFLASVFACYCRPAKCGDASDSFDNSFSTKIKTVTQLEELIKFPPGFMFAEHVVENVGTTMIRVQSSAVQENGQSSALEIKSGTIRIFRAFSVRSDDIEHGEIRWTNGTEIRTTRIKIPDAVMLVVRSIDGETLNWYSLKHELRC